MVRNGGHQAEKSAAARLWERSRNSGEPVASWPPGVLPTAFGDCRSSNVAADPRITSIACGERLSPNCKASRFLRPSPRSLKSGENSPKLEDQLGGQERSVAALYDKFETETCGSGIAATTHRQHHATICGSTKTCERSATRASK